MKIAIIYYSGTNNTKFIAQQIKNKLIVDHQVDLFNIEEIIEDINFAKYNLIMIGHPIYAFDAPRIVTKFIKAMPLATNTQQAIIFKSAGDKAWLNKGASSKLLKLLKKKNYHIIGNYLFAMPTNFYQRQTKEEEQALIIKAISEINTIDFTINQYNKAPLINRCLSRFISSSKQKFFEPRFSKSLQTSDQCIKCMNCLLNCPYNNIEFKENKIQFNKQCGVCMRCIYHCPVDCISSRKYQFAITNPHYQLEVLYEKTNQK